MTRPATAHALPHVVAALAWTGVVFLLDLSSELGIAMATLYVPSVLLVAPTRSDRWTWTLALVCTLLTGLGLATSPEGGEQNKILINRLLSASAIWAVAYMAVRNNAIEHALQGHVREHQRTIGRLEETQALLREREQDRSSRARALCSMMDDIRHERANLLAQIERREQAEREEARLAAIIEDSGDAIIGKTLGGVVTSWNQGAQDLLGYTADEAVGRHIDDLSGARQELAIGDLMDKVARAASGPFEATWRHKNGTDVMVSLTVSPILDAGGEVSGASTIARDVSARVRADQLVRLATEAAPSGMLMVDSRGHIVMVNSKLEEIFGYPREELVGEPVEMLIPERLRTGHPALFAGFIEDPVVRPMGKGRDLLGLTRDGREVPIEIGLTPVWTERGLHVLAAVVDITERTRMIAQLEAKTLEMEQLFYVVSHDLKSPLVTIEGFAGLMQKHLDAGDMEKARDATMRVQRGARTMGRLIDDMLKLSRISSQSLSLEHVELSNVVEEALQTLEGPISACGATIEAPPTSVQVYADRDQLLRVLLNLVGNALKYACKDREGRIRIGGERRRDEVRVYVEDDGPGIPREHHARVFKLFQRLHNDQEGTGVGLATVAKVVERHAGRAWLDPDPGTGARFWVSFPTEEARRCSSELVAAHDSAEAR